MSTALTIGSTGASVSWQQVSTVAGGTVPFASTFSYLPSFTSGTGAGQADLLYVDSTTLAASATRNLDLAGSLTDVFGATITMARVKAIYIELLTTTTASSISVGGHATAGLINWIASAGTFGTDQPNVIVRNGGCLYLCTGATDATGYPVTGTTADILKIHNNDGANVATYRLVVVGCSA